MVRGQILRKTTRHWGPVNLRRRGACRGIAGLAAFRPRRTGPCVERTSAPVAGAVICALLALARGWRSPRLRHRPPARAHRADEIGAQQHDAGPVHVRRRRAADPLQPALYRDAPHAARACAGRHADARPRRPSRRGRHDFRRSRRLYQSAEQIAEGRAASTDSTPTGDGRFISVDCEPMRRAAGWTPTPISRGSSSPSSNATRCATARSGARHDRRADRFVPRPRRNRAQDRQRQRHGDEGGRPDAARHVRPQPRAHRGRGARRTPPRSTSTR